MCDAEEYASLFFEKFLKEIIKSTKGVMRFEILLSKYLFGLEIISHKLFLLLIGGCNYFINRSLSYTPPWIINYSPK